jgi:hypothetical protein
LFVDNIVLAPRKGRADGPLKGSGLLEPKTFTNRRYLDALEEMALHGSGDVVSSVAKAMDQALARVDGPFVSFEESLAAFARANYALRLENGRCTRKDPADCWGFYYDPDHVYVDPALEAQLRYDGHTLLEVGFVPTSSGTEFAGLSVPDGRSKDGTSNVYTGTIPSSYGMDFVDVHLDGALHGRPLAIAFQARGDVARFNVQIWKIEKGQVRPRALTPQPEEIQQQGDSNAPHMYVIPQLDMTAYDRLGLIITRLDPGEAADPIGGYTITLQSH